MEELRCFTFGNFMLSSIQQGIQGAHAIAEMFINYEPTGRSGSMLYEWGDTHKTIVAKNAGDEESVRAILDMFMHKENIYPFSHFEESESALTNSLTCVAIILPEGLYDTGVKQLRNRNVYFNYNPKTGLWAAKDQSTELITEYTDFEYQLLTLLKSTQLAR